MKKLLCLALTMVFCLSAIPLAMAAIPSTPNIDSQMPDCYGYVEEGAVIKLFTDASSPEGYDLYYQWYKSTDGSYDARESIPGATGTSYTPPAKVGVCYYCYEVSARDPQGEWSESMYSRMIRVEYAHEQVEETYELEVLEAPDKTTYYSGEVLDLTGLRVRVWTNDGFFDSKNGDKLEITKKPLTTLGEQKIRVKYKDAMDIFIVTVVEAPKKAAVITAQPMDAQAELNQTASFTCTATNAKSYQWYVTLSGKNQKLSDGDYGASGCTTAALTISAVKELVGASFYCIISGEDDNTVQSAAAKLSITIPEDAPETTPAVDAPTGGDSGGGNTILIVVILLVVVLGAGGIGMVLMNKKKNR